MIRLVATDIQLNKNYDPHRNYNFGTEPREVETEVLRMVITEEEYRAVKMAILQEMQPKKDAL